jgi:TRAP-type uncharacterized transport system substrate-binding protein
MRDGGLDAFFFRRRVSDRRDIGARVGGRGIDLLRSRSRGRQDARSTHSFAPDTIPPNVQRSFGEVKTIAVGGARGSPSAKQPSGDLRGTKALWNENTRKLLDAGHAKGKAIQAATRPPGRPAFPFHPGAETFYKEKGMIK